MECHRFEGRGAWGRVNLSRDKSWQKEYVRNSEGQFLEPFPYKRLVNDDSEKMVTFLPKTTLPHINRPLHRYIYMVGWKYSWQNLMRSRVLDGSRSLTFWEPVCAFERYCLGSHNVNHPSKLKPKLSHQTKVCYLGWSNHGVI